MTWRYMISVFAASAAASIVVSLGMIYMLRRPTPPPLPATETVYCRTGAGPMVVEGYDIEQRINPLYSDVHELVWRMHPDDVGLSSAALQPPIACEDITLRR